jgi:hypothetical protein
LELAEAVLRDVEDASWYVDEPIAAAIVELLYESCFIVPPNEMRALEAELRAEPIPPAVRNLLGERVSAEIASLHRENWMDFLPLAILRRYAKQHARTLGATLSQALKLALNRDLGWSYSDEPPMTWTSLIGESSLQKPARALRARQEFHAARQADRDANDPVLNGRPGKILEPRTGHENDFLHWCSKLGAMLASPRASARRSPRCCRPGSQLWPAPSSSAAAAAHLA